MGNVFTVSYLHVFHKVNTNNLSIDVILKFLHNTSITFHEIPCRCGCFVQLLHMQNSGS